MKANKELAICAPLATTSDGRTADEVLATNPPLSLEIGLTVENEILKYSTQEVPDQISLLLFRKRNLKRRSQVVD